MMCLFAMAATRQLYGAGRTGRGNWYTGYHSGEVRRRTTGGSGKSALLCYWILPELKLSPSFCLQRYEVFTGI
jgi:hypothetical protein